MSKKDKRKAMTWKDWIFWYGSIFGSLFVLVACAPPVPWRRAGPSSSFGQRFVVGRGMGLFTVSNQYGQAMSWFKMKSEVCRKLQEFSRPNPLAVGLSLGSMMVASSSDGAMSSGGAILGCGAWQACKEHVGMRCSAYTGVAAVGLVAFLLMLFGAVAAVMATILMTKEEHVKKKKKRKEEAQWNTALASIFGWVLPTLGTIAWSVTTESLFKGLQKNSHYPFPAANVGIYLALFGEILLFAAMVAGIRRQDYYQELEEEEEEEVYAPGVAAPGMAPGMPPGQMPPGMQPSGGMPGAMPGLAAPPPPMYAR